MLSQRIAYYANRLVATEDSLGYEEARTNLLELRQQMQIHQNGLQAGNDSMGLEVALDKINSGPLATELDSALGEYLYMVKKLAEIPVIDLDESLPELQYINRVTEEKSLLNLLDRVVSAYEEHARSQAISIQRQEFGILGLTLAVLILEVIFIFQPLYRKLQDQHQTLENQLIALRHR